MPEMRDGLLHFDWAQVRVGKRIDVWFAPGSRRVAGIVRDIIRDELGTLCVSIGLEGDGVLRSDVALCGSDGIGSYLSADPIAEELQSVIRQERLSTRVHEGLAETPEN